MFLDDLYASDTMLSRLRSSTVRLLERLGLVQPVRRLWRRTYGLLFSRRTVRVSIENVSFRAVVPTVDYLEDAVNLWFEADELLIFLEYLWPEAVIWDIGSNAGLYAVACALNTPTAHIHAFEPIPANCAVIQRNITINHLQNVTLHQMALSNMAGSMPMFGHDLRTGSFSLHYRPGLKPGNAVRVTTGDVLVAIEQLPPPTHIKIDAEGFEYEVIEGLQQSLRSASHVIIMVEQHDRILAERHLPLRREEPLLEELGFVCKQRLPACQKSIWEKAP